jgi:hypothetical protein
MKRPNPLIIPLTMLFVGIALNSFADSTRLSQARIESLLSAAGFQILTEPDALQEVWYTRAVPDILERHIANGKIVYTYADQRGGFIYIGGSFEYQQFKRIYREASVAQAQWQATETVYKPWRDWDWTWKPWKLLVWGYQPGSW